MHTPISAVFSIISYKRDQEVFVSHGSAFFINAEGVFVTAGHNFKNPTRTNKAIINGHAYDIEKLYWEYKDHEDQQPDIYYDLFIGKISGLQTPNFHPLNENLLLSESSELVAVGYNFQNYGPPVDLYDIHDDLLSDDEAPDLSADEERINRLRFGRITAKYSKQGFEHIDKYIQQSRYSNGFTMQLPVAEPHGYSGGPILSEENTVGMLIGEQGAIGAAYISEKLKNINGKPDENANSVQLATPLTPANRWLQDCAVNVHRSLNVRGGAYEALFQHICYVSTDDLHLLDTQLLQALSKGIGGTKGNYYHAAYNRYVHLVVINPSLCDRLNFTASEIEGAIAHELGHLFNIYEKKPEPNILAHWQSGTPIDPEEVKRIKYENALNTEQFADAFARTHGYGNRIARGLNKYCSLSDAENVGMISERIVNLQTEHAPLIGQTIILAKIPNPNLNS